MTYKIVLEQSEEGWSVHVPGLPGCWSQGDTEDEALRNIKHAIREYLQARDELVRERFGRLNVQASRSFAKEGTP